ncbi:MAG TPA: MalY/PatB family protein [Phototrophicaceae bacterium]|nr:MalY/PatB family protein [Phototrophicaceae bacterium]
MATNLNTFIDRRHQFDCAKWTMYPEEVIPLWVADMDFLSPEPVIRALHERVDHGIFGYQSDSPSLREVLIERLSKRHHLQVTSEQITFLPGLVFGLNTVARMIGAPGTGVLMNTPIYPPFLSAPKNSDRLVQTAPLASSVTDGILRYELDFDALEAAVTPDTRLFLLCNPHNPIGRVYTRKELEQIAEFVLRHDLILCADEIHCDLTYGDVPHTSIASLSPEIADRTITLLAPSKTFNLPGFGLGFCVIQNESLRTNLQETLHKIGSGVNALAYTAAEAAYRDGQPWLDEVLAYLKENRDALVDFVRETLPDLPITQPEGTYLAWLDCRSLNLQPDPYKFLLDNAHVAFSSGEAFGAPGFIRINYATTRDTLIEGMNRTARALGR